MGKVIRAANRVGARGKANQKAQKDLNKTDKKLDKIEKGKKP
jgi:hypothetical protein